MNHNIYKFSLFLKILCFVSKGSLNIPEYRCLLIGRVQSLYTIEHVVENISFHRFQSISVTLLSLVSFSTEVTCACLLQENIKKLGYKGALCTLSKIIS